MHETMAIVVVSLETPAHHIVDGLIKSAAPLARHCTPVTVEMPRQEPSWYALFLGLLRRSQTVARLAATHSAQATTVLCHGCLDAPTHPALLRLYRDLEAALAAKARRGPDVHVLVYLRCSLHECFESIMAADQGTVDPVPFHRLVDAQARLESSMVSSSVASASSTTTVARHMVRCPPFLEDNPYDAARIARAIADIANHYASATAVT